MRYKILLVSVLTACLFAGCSRSKDSVTGFLQNNRGELTQDSENKNDLTQDNIVDSMENDKEQQSDTIQNEGSINSDILNKPNNTIFQTQEHNKLENLSEGENDKFDDLTTDSSDSDENSMVVPTQVPGESPEIYPTMDPESDQPVPTKIPDISIEPTKVPEVTIRPTSVPVPRPTRIPAANQTPAPTKAPVAPTNEPSQEKNISLYVRGTEILLGESKSSVLKKLGSPVRIDETEYTYSFMVYNDNYKKFVMVAVQNDKVVGWYTDATDFNYCGLTQSSDVNSINALYDKNLSIKKTLSVTSDGVTSVFFMDMLGDHTIDGVLVTADKTTDGVTSAVLTAWEKEVLDLTNSFRARNGLNALKWSMEAATAARLHSQDMADHNFFDHNGSDGSTPFTRMKAQGISFTMAGENIIGGYGNALYSTNGWINSNGHRNNILNSSYNYLGVGYVFGGSYGNYATQNFFKK